MKSPENYIEILRRYNHAYYNLREPEVSDVEYDAIKSEFKTFYPDHPFLHTEDFQNEQSRKRAFHSVPMISYDTLSSETEFRNWASRVSNDGLFCVSEKVSGQSFSASYFQGRFFQAITKGDGKQGFDVSRDLRTKLPLVLPASISVLLMGVVSNEKVYFYDLRGDMVFHLEHQKLDYLNSVLKLNTPFYKQAALEEVVRLLKNYKKSKADAKGLIVKVNSKIQQELLGVDDDHPQHSINLKL